MNEMVKRVALAICKRRFGSTGKHMWQEWTTEAEAAIAAMREPTEAMLDAAYNPESFGEDYYAKGIYRAMIDAALKE